MELEMTQATAAQSGWAERCNRFCSRVGSFLACRFGKVRASAESALRLEEKLSLGPKKMLYLVSCGEKEFLIAAGADAIVSIVEVSSSELGKAPCNQRASMARMQKRERLS